MAEREIVEKMLNVIRHRGPDSTRVYKGGKLFAGVVASNLSQPRGNGFAKEGDFKENFAIRAFGDKSCVRVKREIVEIVEIVQAVQVV